MLWNLGTSHLFTYLWYHYFQIWSKHPAKIMGYFCFLNQTKSESSTKNYAHFRPGPFYLFFPFWIKKWGQFWYKFERQTIDCHWGSKWSWFEILQFWGYLYIVLKEALINRAIFQTFWKNDCCTKFLFFELETLNFGHLPIFLFPLTVQSFSKIKQHWY